MKAAGHILKVNEINGLFKWRESLTKNIPRYGSVNCLLFAFVVDTLRRVGYCNLSAQSWYARCRQSALSEIHPRYVIHHTISNLPISISRSLRKTRWLLFLTIWISFLYHRIRFKFILIIIAWHEHIRLDWPQNILKGSRVWLRCGTICSQTINKRRTYRQMGAMAGFVSRASSGLMHTHGESTA